MIQLNYFYFSILLFGWSNKKIHCHHFWTTFINFKNFGLKFENWNYRSICKFQKKNWGVKL